MYLKRLAPILVFLWFLTGCAGSQEDALTLREKLLSEGCVFQGEITADYGDTLSVFTLDCVCSPQGDVSFTVAAPESIQGITGRICAGKGTLIFDGTGLSFPLLADGQLSPVSAPWILCRTLRSGYLKSAGMEGALTRLTLDDSFEAHPIQADVWLEAGVPIRAELCWKGEKILSITLRQFRTESIDGA